MNELRRNMELKCRVKDTVTLQYKIQALSGKEALLLEQTDTFFHAESGRLKLREFNDGKTAQLIAYHRSDGHEIRPSDFSIVEIKKPAALKSTLERSLGIVGIIKKKRLLWIINDTRIHLDNVSGLGDFIEFEAMLIHGRNEADGLAAIEIFLKALQLESAERIERAYIDLLLSEARVK